MDKIYLPISSKLQDYIVRAIAFKQGEEDMSVFTYVPRLFPAFMFILKECRHVEMSNGSKPYLLKSATIHYAGIGCKPAKIACSSDMTVFVVLLYPYSLPFFFRDDACHFSGALFDMTDMAPDVHLLNEQVNEADCLETKWLHIQSFFANRFSGKSGYTYHYAVNAVRFIQQHKGVTDIHEIANQSCTTPRNLLDVFKQHIGMSPKKFTDALRFNTFVNHFQQQRHLTMFESALAHGYYDLSHLHKDFSRFTGISPSGFFTLIQTSEPKQFGNWEEAVYLRAGNPAAFVQ